MFYLKLSRNMLFLKLHMCVQCGGSCPGSAFRMDYFKTLNIDQGTEIRLEFEGLILFSG